MTASANHFKPRENPQANSHANGLLYRQADFESLPQAMDYAALSDRGICFYSLRGDHKNDVSYTRIRAQAIHLAKCLRAIGLERGQHLGIVAEMGPDFYTTFYACQYGGFVAIPLPVISGLGGRRGYELQLARIFQHSEMRAVIIPETSSATFLNLKGIPAPERILTVPQLLAREPSDQPCEPLRPDEISHIQFSSGSTRFPLGIEISQRALMANARSIAADGLDLRPDDRIASWLPFYHDMGLIGQCIVPVTCQINVDFLDPADFSRRPLRWLELISENRCTMSFGPDFGYEICTRLADKKLPVGLDLSSWRVAGIGGDMVRPHILRSFAARFAEFGFRESAFVPSYGLAEATLAVSFPAPGGGMHVDEIDHRALTAEGHAKPVTNGAGSDSFLRSITSCGFPLPGYHVEIRAADADVLPERRVGAVWISAPSRMTCYHNEPEATRRCIDENGWLDTGDMGYLADGQLYITGRHKDMIIIKGRNIWPQDLEWHVEREVPGLQGRNCAAFSHLARDGEETAVILVQSRKNDPATEEQLRKNVAAVVSRNVGILCRVEIIPNRSLPFTTSGKLIRSKAKQDWLEGLYDPDRATTSDSA